MRWTGKLPWDVIKEEMEKAERRKPRPDPNALQAKVDRERKHVSKLGGTAVGSVLRPQGRP